MDSLQVDFVVTVPPSVEPVTLTDLRATNTGSYLRVDFTSEDNVLTTLITSCRMLAEQITGKGFAPQTIQVMFTMPQVNGNTLSGASLLYEQDFYQYNESLGANPFSPAPFVLKVPLSPLVSVSMFEYRVTVFSAWQTWPQSVSGINNYVAETLPMPGLVYLQYPPPAYQYRLTCSVGYATLPADLKLALLQLIAWKYENRSAEEPPAEVFNALLARKTWVL
jgi:hypothetical protein